MKQILAVLLLMLLVVGCADPDSSTTGINKDIDTTLEFAVSGSNNVQYVMITSDLVGGASDLGEQTASGNEQVTELPIELTAQRFSEAALGVASGKLSDATSKLDNRKTDSDNPDNSTTNNTVEEAPPVPVPDSDTEEPTPPQDEPAPEPNEPDDDTDIVTKSSALRTFEYMGDTRTFEKISSTLMTISSPVTFLFSDGATFTVKDPSKNWCEDPSLQKCGTHDMEYKKGMYYLAKDEESKKSVIFSKLGTTPESVTWTYKK